MTSATPDSEIVRGDPAPGRVPAAEPTHSSQRSSALGASVVFLAQLSAARTSIEIASGTGLARADAIGAVAGPHGAAREAAQRSLRAEVEAVVQEFRGAGMTPEKVLVRVKSEVRAACAHGGEAYSVVAMTDGIVSDAVRWSIAEYYRTR